MIAPRTLNTDLDWADWRCTAPLPPRPFRAMVEHMGLCGCKWDLQVGDTPALAPFALTLSRSSYSSLCDLAERLTTELETAEAALTQRPDLWSHLGLPSRIRRMLSNDLPWTPTAARVIRYDFHPTTDGWRISEANSDVPGGFNEASTFTTLVAELTPELEPADDPLCELATALATAADPFRSVAVVVAPGYREDLQVVSGLAEALRRRGVPTVTLTPEQLRWENGHAQARLGDVCHEFGAIYRFFQGEWSPRVQSPHWRQVFRGGKTPVCNPAAAVLSESKRLPLVWQELGIEVPTWRGLLPPTTNPWHAGAPSSRWVYKNAYGNNGEAVFSARWSSRTMLPWLESLTFPRRHIAQSRFETLQLMTPNGPMYPCIGIYTINGRASGIYGRLSVNPLVDYAAQDVAVLIRR